MDMHLLPRHTAADVLRLARSFPAVAVVGPRQVGKTTLAKQLLNQLPQPGRYFDLEYPEHWAAFQEPVRLLERLAGECVVIDEVQRLPGLFPVLRSLIDQDRRPGRMILLGSASPDLIQQSSETLAGRIAYVELQPFAYAELPQTAAWQDYWVRGGFPGSWLAGSLQESADWRRAFIRSYLERDLPLLGLKADPLLLNRLWTMLAHLNGQLLNKEKLSGSLGIHAATLRKYLDFFESAYLIRRLQPYYGNAGKRLVKSPKVYIRDTGILLQLLGVSDFTSLMSHPGLGSAWEALVIQQLAFHLPPGWELCFYRTHDGAEADLVVMRGGTPQMLLEMKFSSAPSVSRGFYQIRDTLKTETNLVVAPVGMPFPAKDGVEVVGLKQLPELFAAGLPYRST
jgi:hypothetical protein